MRLSIRIVSIALVVLAFLITAASAQTTSIRITASEAIVRQSADPHGAVMATLKAGTVLQVAAERNGWYEVILPAAAGAAPRRGYIAAASAERFSESRLNLGLPASAASPSAVTLGAPLAADWQGRYDRAVSRRRSGVTKYWIGAPLALAGGGLSIYALIKELRSSEEERAARSFWDLQGPAYVLAGGGGALTAIGQRQIRRAAEEMLLLEQERTRAQQGVVYSRPLSGGKLLTALDLGAGRQISAALRMSW